MLQPVGYEGAARLVSEEPAWYHSGIQWKKDHTRKMTKLDDLSEQNPYVQKEKEERREIGHKEGLIEGLQIAFVIIVHGRFPPLTELAQQGIVKVTKPDQLDLLLRAVVTAPDEAIMRWILSSIEKLYRHG